MKKKIEDEIMNFLSMPDKASKENRRLGIDKPAQKVICNYLKEMFLDNPKNTIFDDKFIQAISGSGDELFKMNAPWSSSLCALLFFYNVNKDNPLTINEVEYTESYFEVKNEVFDSPSNMDVVLKGKKGEQEYLLFVECKFTEYLTPGTTYISPKYKKNDTYNALLNNDNKLKLVNHSKNNYIAYWNGERLFADGIKQIIAHSIGLTNFVKKNIKKDRYSDSRKSLFEKDYKVSFVEIIFNFGTIFKNEYNNYFAAVEHLMDLIKIEGVEMLKPLSYQKLLEKNKTFKLEEKVIDYYHYNK